MLKIVLNVKFYMYNRLIIRLLSKLESSTAEGLMEIRKGGLEPGKCPV